MYDNEKILKYYKCLICFFILGLFIFPGSEIYALTYVVEIQNGSASPGCEEINECYLPYSVTINRGETVEWQNNDSAAHTVTSGTPTEGSNGLFDSSMIMSGSNFAFTFGDAGTYPYFCAIHPWMTGEIVVNEIKEMVMDEPEPADSDKDGIIDDVDACDFVPEDFDGVDDSDGCPEDDPVWTYAVIGVGVAGAGAAIGIKLYGKSHPPKPDGSQDIPANVEVRVVGGIEE